MTKVFECGFSRILDSIPDKFQKILDQIDQKGALGWEFKGQIEHINENMLSETVLIFQREKVTSVIITPSTPPVSAPTPT